MNLIREKIIKLPKVLVGNKAKYKVVNQTIKVEHCLDYSVISHHIVLRLPRFCIDKKSILEDIKYACFRMRSENTIVRTIGWGDAGCKTYKVMILYIIGGN